MERTVPGAVTSIHFSDGVEPLNCTYTRCPVESQAGRPSLPVRNVSRVVVPCETE
jgi:hypothetical protein